MEDLALDRPAFENVSLGRVELVEPRGKERLDRRRNGNRASVVGLLDERQHLLDEERVATRRSADTQVQRLLQRGALEQTGDQLVCLLFGERLQQHTGRVEFAATPSGSTVEQLGTRHAEEQDREAAREIGDVLDQVQERLLAPLDVVEQTDDW